MKTLMTVALAVLPSLGAAQERVNETRPAAPDGLVSIEIPAGTISVVGWDKSEVAVTGRLGAGALGLSLRGGKGGQTYVEVETRGNPHSVHSDLEVRVPAGSRVSVESFGADITVTGVAGGVTAETVNGSIRVGEGARAVQAESVNGGVEVDSRSGSVQAESVNGPVTVRGAAEAIDASTVNGPLLVNVPSFARGRLETVNGSIHFEGDLAPRGTMDVETVSGSVELALSDRSAANFSISTFSGNIRNELGPPAARVSRHTTEKELSFSTGGGGATVTVETLSGEIVLRRRRN
jgi:hypothetical protein